jgi:hypothetical protein
MVPFSTSAKSLWVNNLVFFRGGWEGERDMAVWNVAYLIQELLRSWTTKWKTYNALTLPALLFIRTVHSTSGTFDKWHLTIGLATFTFYLKQNWLVRLDVRQLGLNVINIQQLQPDYWKLYVIENNGRTVNSLQLFLRVTLLKQWSYVSDYVMFYSTFLNQHINEKLRFSTFTNQFCNFFTQVVI